MQSRIFTVIFQKEILKRLKDSKHLLQRVTRVHIRVLCGM